MAADSDCRSASRLLCSSIATTAASSSGVIRAYLLAPAASSVSTPSSTRRPAELLAALALVDAIGPALLEP